MRLGIDFGTTRVAVAAADRGNFPVISFECPDGEVRDWFPPLIAAREAELRFGWNAWMSQGEEGWIVVRSIKRLLSDAGLDTPVEIGSQRFHMHQLLQGLTSALRDDLIERSNLRLDRSEPLEVMLGVPANSNSNQRFLTAEAFSLSGFSVIGILNEPSAASIEFGHSQRLSGRAKERGCVLVYDLGGGTFDASLVEIDEQTHSVLASEGLETLGGDDFDEILAELALQTAGWDAARIDGLRQDEIFRLHEECRVKKEALHPNTRKITIDLESARPGAGEVSVSVAAFYDACRPLIQETLHTVEDLLAAHGLGSERRKEDSSRYRLDAVYVTGGASCLPLVGRELRERFDRRVQRSAHARFATAIGLAIQADTETDYMLRDRFTRYFGVWREADGGTAIWFDALFQKGEPLPGPGEWAIEITRRYSPVHNVGHFRYLECSRLGETGQPAGDITLWDEIRFPFDPALEHYENLEAVPVEHSEIARQQLIEETYTCDAGGALGVAVTNISANYNRTYRLARWATHEAPVKPGRRKPVVRRARGQSPA